MLTLTAAQRETVTVTVLEAVGGSRDDVLFAAGSMVDGLANAGSDLDIYFVRTGIGTAVGEDVTMRRREQNGTIGQLDGRDINVSVLDTEALTELGSSFRSCLAFLDGGRGIAQLDSENDLKLLHRIRTGQALLGEDGLGALRRSLDCDRLPVYLAHLYLVTAVNRLTDVAGERAAGSDTSAAWMFREAAVHLGQLVLAVSGETNPSRKWLVRLLGRPGPYEAISRWVVRLLVPPAGDEPGDLAGDLAAAWVALRALLVAAPEYLTAPFVHDLVLKRP